MSHSGPEFEPHEPADPRLADNRPPDPVAGPGHREVGRPHAAEATSGAAAGTSASGSEWVGPSGPAYGSPASWGTGQPNPGGPAASWAPQPVGNYAGQAPHPPGSYPGQGLQYGTTGPYPPAYPPGYGAYPTMQSSAPLNPAVYASWPRRVAAALIDSLPGYLLSIPWVVAYVLFLRAITQSQYGTTPSLGAAVTWMVVGTALWLVNLGWAIYNRWLRGGRTGQSLGKRVLHIWLISEQTRQPIGALNAFLRDLVHVVDGLAYVGYLWPLWDAKRQTFADKIMQTVVVNDSAAPDLSRS